MVNAAEILRKLADIIELMNGTPAALKSDETDVMVPPLQQNLELLKMANGVENHFSDQEKKDDLDIIKQTAGVSPIPE
jgi:hypothetical protein